MTARLYANFVASAAAALKERREEVNKLNVFPVPDGDTGTNMSLTMDVVVAELSKLPDSADTAALCHAVTHASLMGARGNSGVILSQILRGVCEGIGNAETVDAEMLATALERSVVVAFQAVRKPVEGTILTVLRDTAEAARTCADSGAPLPDALRSISVAAFESVRRTPDLLAVLRENGVVDAGGYGLAILIEGLVAAALGEKIAVADVSIASAPPLLSMELADDWDDQEYLYCTEFLLFGDDIECDSVLEYVSSMGGSELVVGTAGEFKIHVHTNDPGAVLEHMTAIGELAEVHINNMRRQTRARGAVLAAEASMAPLGPLKPLGVVAVAAGDGLAAILTSLGVDVVVSGGQTMNPSTRDLADAIGRVHAEKVIVLPNNKNIIMAANAAATVATKPVAVVPTTAVPQAFSAMLAYDDAGELDAVVEAMTEAASEVRAGEVTTAVKDAKGKVGAIRAGQVIGIADHEIEVVGDDVSSVAAELASILLDGGRETLTLLAGADLTDQALAGLAEALHARHPDVDIETHRGDQPLYPVLMSAE